MYKNSIHEGCHKLKEKDKRTTGNDRGLQINPSPLLALKYCSNCGITRSFIVNSLNENITFSGNQFANVGNGMLNYI